MHKFIDDKGRTWQEFGCSYTHPLDDQTLSFNIWAIDHDDAQERLKIIGELGKVDGALVEVINWE